MPKGMDVSCRASFYRPLTFADIADICREWEEKNDNDCILLIDDWVMKRIMMIKKQTKTPTQ